MGKAQSKPENGEVYVVQPRPVAYDLESSTTRPLSPNQEILVLKPSESSRRRPPRRSQSLQSLHDRPNGMMTSKWQSFTTRKDILDRKAYYMGRYQTKVINEANLDTLRMAVRQAKLKKTRVRMSPLGFSFGSKPGGLLNTDKVAYQFIPLEDIQTLRLDSIMRDVMLCIFRIDHNRNNQNDVVPEAVAQHYEINAFHMEPRDAVLFQRAHGDFKSKGPLYQQMYKQEAIKTRTMSQNVLEEQNGWQSASNINNNTLLSGPARSERDIRVRGPNSDIYRHSTGVTHGSVDNLDSSSAVYVQSGRKLHLQQQPRTIQRRQSSRDVGISPRYPEPSNGNLNATRGHSITTRVYFNYDRPMADVECQISPDTTHEVGPSSTTTGSTIDPSNNFRSRSSSQSTTRSVTSSNNRNDSVKRRIRTLSREMEQLRTMIDGSDDDLPRQNGIGNIMEEGSSSSESTVRANGPATRISAPPNTYSRQDHAGSINTMLGKVDVVVDQPNMNGSSRPGARRQHDGYLSESQTVSHGDSRVRRHASDRSRADTEVAGRYIYYRPVAPDRINYQGRSRSTEPPPMRRKKNWIR